MSAKVFGGEEVKIFTSGGEIDPNIYNVEFVKRDLIGLACKETGITIKVNNQRIYKVIKENVMNEEAITNDENQTQTISPAEITVEPSESNAEETQPVERAKKEKKAKAAPELIDFQAMADNGYEIWTRTGLSLGDDPKVSEIAVSAHCVIDPEDIEERGYEVFNSYNGTRGAKGNNGKHYLFTEKMTVEKKRKALEKKGYVRFGSDNENN